MDEEFNVLFITNIGSFTTKLPDLIENRLSDPILKRKVSIEALFI